jgi:hypothetical protein
MMQIEQVLSEIALVDSYNPAGIVVELVNTMRRHFYPCADHWLNLRIRPFDAGSIIFIMELPDR